MDRAVACAVIALLSVTSIAGCISGERGLDIGAAEPPHSSRPTVVALIDSGITPYHGAFRAVPGGVRVDDHLHLAPGVELVRDLRREDYEPGRLYAFSGTRIFAISLKNTTGAAPVVDERDHGTGTASLVAREDPRALIVMIQVETNGCPSPSEDCPIYPALGAAMEWAAEQPWIDIISVSLGPPGNAPSVLAAFPDAAHYFAASRRAHDAGKLVVTASGNQVVPAHAQHMAGPPWFIVVGGFDSVSQGESVHASKGVDVVANWSDVVAIASTEDGMGANLGTSISAPIVAGTLSRALYEVRSLLSHRGGLTPEGSLAVGRDAMGTPVRVTSQDLRDAMNTTAVHVGASAWDPTRSRWNGTLSLVDRTAPVLLPAAQMGWGYVESSLAPAIASRVLTGDLQVPPSKALTATFQEQQQAAREAYWRS